MGTPFLAPPQWPHPKLLPVEVGHPSQFHTAQTPPGMKERENFNAKGELRFGSFPSFVLSQKLQEGAKRVTALNLFTFSHTHLFQSSELASFQLLIGNSFTK